jgi:tetratricopeptide (TPR) repeat protein
MDAILAVEPGISSYHWQQAMLYGAAAETLDGAAADAAAQAALRAFDRVIALEPQIAGGWANRAGLRWEAGQTDAALDDWRAAAEAAPDSWQLWLAYARMSEQAGRDDDARGGYARLIAALGDEDRAGVTLHPVLAASPIFAALDAPPTTDLAEIVRLWLRDDDPAGALAAWEAAPASVTGDAAGRTVRALLASELGDPAGAAAWRDQAAQSDAVVWLAYLDARLNGGDAAAVLATTPGDLSTPDLSSRINWWQGAFMRETTRRNFLIVARYESLDPLLVALSGASPSID